MSIERSRLPRYEIYETVEAYHPVKMNISAFPAHHCLNCDLLVAKKVGVARW